MLLGRGRGFAAYDPEWIAARDRYVADVQSMRGDPGPYAIDPAVQLVAMGGLFEQLAAGLPAVVVGRQASYWTPAQQQAFAFQIAVFQMPGVAPIFQLLEPSVRELAESEVRMIVSWASDLSP